MTESEKTKSNLDNTSSTHTSIDDKLALLRLRRIPNLPAWVIEEIRAALTSDEAELASDVAPNSLPDHKNTELRVRQLIQGGAPWQAISEILWSDYVQSPSEQKAARLIETCFVQASPVETIEVFMRLMNDGSRSFYWLLHPRIRDFLLEHAEASIVEALFWMVAREKSGSRLTDVEILFTFLRLNDAKDKTAAWIFYKKNEQRIAACCAEHQYFGYSKDQIALKLGELALQLGYDEDARDLFSGLPRPSKERDLALHLLVRYESSTFDKSKNGYAIKLEAATSWQERIQLLEEFCQDIRRGGGLRDPNRSALNFIMKSSQQWISRSVDSWRALGELVVRNRDLSDLIPSLYQLFYDSSCVYYAPDLDQALWLSVLHLRPQSNVEAYLSGLAWLHYFVASPQRTDAALWTARNMIEYALTQTPAGFPWTWRELVRTSLNHAERSQQILDRDRKRIMAVLRVSVDGASSSQEVINSYLTLSDSPAVEILDDLSRQAWQKKDFQIFISLMARRADVSMYSNEVLARLWHASVVGNDHDLSWRVATVLASREVLSSKVQHSWEISGERRSVYAANALSNIDIELALTTFPKTTRRMLHCLYLLGAKIGELAECTKKSSLSDRSPIAAVGITENAVIKSLAKMGLIQGSKSVYQSKQLAELPLDFAALIQSPEYNPWIFTVRVLVERMGLAAWAYERKELKELMGSVLPYIGSTTGEQITAKLGKWLSSLSTHQRAAWSELPSVLAEISDEDFSFALIQFAVRLGVMVYPSHFDALRSLQKSRATLATIRSFETFLLSPVYSDFRRRTGVHSRVIVPTALAAEDFNVIGNSRL